MSVFAGAYRGSGKNANVVIAVNMDATRLDLVEGAATTGGQVEVAAVAVSATGKVAGSQRERFTLALKPDSWANAKEAGHSPGHRHDVAARPISAAGRRGQYHGATGRERDVRPRGAGLLEGAARDERTRPDVAAIVRDIDRGLDDRTPGRTDGTPSPSATSPPATRCRSTPRSTTTGRRMRIDSTWSQNSDGRMAPASDPPVTDTRATPQAVQKFEATLPLDVPPAPTSCTSRRARRWRSNRPSAATFRCASGKGDCHVPVLGFSLSQFAFTFDSGVRSSR